jgi:hypothetical protein
MNISARSRRSGRLIPVLSACAGAVLALGAAALPSAALAAPAAAHAVAGTSAAVTSGWGNAQEVTGIAALNKAGSAAVNSVSCPAAGSCGAVGVYTVSNGGYLHTRPFVVNEKQGAWSTGKQLPGAEILSHRSLTIPSVSCASPGNCSTGGSYATSSTATQAFVASRVNYTWDDATEVPGLAALNDLDVAAVTSVSCASAGNCSAGGNYAGTGGHGGHEAFVVSQTNGAWGNAIEVPGTAALNQADATINAVACGSAGNCSAGGSYYGTRGYQAFVVNEVSGTWDQAIEVPGTAALNQGDAAVNTVSCATATSCSAGGSYTDSSGHAQAFVVTRTS